MAAAPKGGSGRDGTATTGGGGGGGGGGGVAQAASTERPAAATTLRDLVNVKLIIQASPSVCRHHAIPTAQRLSPG
ncbi:hypothetical protein EGO55_13310 [Caenibius tardaugens NBRC 16725]|nr:hypothetical protein EGO55_13310 [Caenibius tardaugens NBRC 16725]